jgi:hypothetical protein
MEYYQSSVPEKNDMQSKYDGNIYYVMSVKYELTMSVGFKTKGIMVLSRKGVFKWFWVKNLHFFMSFLSLGFWVWNLVSLLSRNPTPSLFSSPLIFPKFPLLPWQDFYVMFLHDTISLWKLLDLWMSLNSSLLQEVRVW